jgi:hypothetical protein
MNRAAVSPTRSARSSNSRKPRAKRSRPSIAKCRSTSLNPEIYVHGEGAFGTVEFRRAHLRNKRGYVYLCWRDGDRVRNFYLGKAPRKSPTDVRSSSSPAATSTRPAAIARSARP